MVEQTIGFTLAIDIGEKMIRANGSETFTFELDRLRSEMLLQGLDPVAATLTRADEIERFEQNDRLRRPWVLLV